MVLGTASRHWRLGGLSFICASTLGPIGHHFSRQLLVPLVRAGGICSSPSVPASPPISSPSIFERCQSHELLRSHRLSNSACDPRLTNPHVTQSAVPMLDVVR